MHIGHLIRATLASGVIVPLYVYPDVKHESTKCSQWTPLLDAISAQPNLPFWVIVNPATGAGPDGSQPDSNYQACIPRLQSPKVVLLGYVATGRGRDSQSLVYNNISTYAGWDAAYRPVGIFFDEVSGESGDFSLYSDYAGAARQAFDGGNGFVVLNPGTNRDDIDYYSIANIVVSEEESYYDFSSSDLSFSASNPASKQAVILYDAPAAPSTSLVDQLIRTDGIKALYLTDNDYSELPSQFGTFVNDVASAAA